MIGIGARKQLSCADIQHTLNRVAVETGKLRFYELCRAARVNSLTPFRWQMMLYLDSNIK